MLLSVPVVLFKVGALATSTCAMYQMDLVRLASALWVLPTLHAVVIIGSTWIVIFYPN